eukprot:527822-Rhodomonas_salina.1
MSAGVTISIKKRNSSLLRSEIFVTETGLQSHRVPPAMRDPRCRSRRSECIARQESDPGERRSASRCLRRVSFDFVDHCPLDDMTLRNASIAGTLGNIL